MSSSIYKRLARESCTAWRTDAMYGIAGQKAMAVRFQAPPQPGRPLLDTHLRQLSLPPAVLGLPLQHNLAALNSLSLPQYPLSSMKSRVAPPPAPRQYSLPTVPNSLGINGLFPRRQPEMPTLPPQPGNTSLPCWSRPEDSASAFRHGRDKIDNLRTFLD